MILGAVEWFRPLTDGELERAEHVLEACRTLGIKHLRFDLSWAHSHVPGALAWYDELIDRMSTELELLPCITYTPPSLGIVASSASPPREPKTYADFIDLVLCRWGRHFDTIELWNEPNGLPYWRFDIDVGWKLFRRMIGLAAHWAKHQHGKRVVLGGMSPIDVQWLSAMGYDSALDCIDIVSVHGFPGTWDAPDRPGYPWKGWHIHLSEIRKTLSRIGSNAELWITEVGASSRRGEDLQIRVLADLLAAPIPRAYWYSVDDFAGDTIQEREEGWVSPDDYHMGLYERVQAAGQPGFTPKKLARLWAAEGIEGVRRRAAGMPTLFEASS
ncbi:hypothetical protein BH24PSE2_BH24PSE2_07020 [soil metagenome]